MRRLALVILLIATARGPAAEVQTRARSVVCSAWNNFTLREWIDWAKGLKGKPVPGPVAAGARNECLSLQVLYVPAGLPKEVRARAGALRSESGAAIPASAVQVRMVQYVPFGERWLPDPLMADQPFGQPAHGPVVFWLTIHVPADARPGVYRGTLAMRADAGPVHVQSYTIRVWNVTLGSETHLRTSFWLFRGQIIRYFNLAGNLPMRDYCPYIDLATSHRICPIDVMEGPADQMVAFARRPDGMLRYDFSRWDAYLDRLRQGGANTIHLGFTHNMGLAFSKGRPAVLDPAAGRRSPHANEVGGPAHLAALAAYLRLAARHLQDRGDLGKCYIQVADEPHNSGLGKAYAIMKTVAEAVPDVPLLVTAAYPDDASGRMKDVVRIWCPLTSRYTQKRFEQVRRRGDEVWWYVATIPRRPYANFFTNYRPAEMRILFWQTWQRRITGLLYWGLNFWNSWTLEYPPLETRFPRGPWRSTTTFVDIDAMGSGYLMYPGPAVGRPLSSIRLETIRDGIEDYELLYLLNSLVERKRGADRDTLALAREVLSVRPRVSASLTRFDRTGAAIDQERAVIAGLIEKLQSLPDESEPSAN